MIEKLSRKGEKRDGLIVKVGRFKETIARKTRKKCNRQRIIVYSTLEFATFWKWKKLSFAINRYEHEKKWDWMPDTF